MEPLEELPARSMSFGSSEKTLGGKPRLVHEKQDLLSLVAETLGNRGRNVCRLETLHRRTVGRRYDEHSPLLSLGTKVLLDELPHLASALADKGKDRDVRLGIADDRCEQSRLAAASRGEYPHTLPLAAGEKPVDCANAKRNGLGNYPAFKRRRRLCVYRIVSVWA